MHKYWFMFFNSWGKTVPYHTMLWLWLPISLLREKSFWILFSSFDSRTKDGDHHCRCNTYLSVLLFIILGLPFVKKKADQCAEMFQVSYSYNRPPERVESRVWNSSACKWLMKAITCCACGEMLVRNLRKIRLPEIAKQLYIPVLFCIWTILFSCVSCCLMMISCWTEIHEFTAGC